MTPSGEAISEAPPAPAATSPIIVPGDALGRDAEGRPVLVGGRCAACGVATFPRQPVCPVCMSEDMSAEEMPRRGILYSCTLVHVGPAKWMKPFMLGYVDLHNAVRVFSHIRGNDPKIGAEVELDTAEIGHDADGTPLVGFVFGPVGEG